MSFTAAITHEGSLVVARCLEVEVTSQGTSIDDAIDNLREALELYFEGENAPAGFENPLIKCFQLTT